MIYCAFMALLCFSFVFGWLVSSFLPNFLFTFNFSDADKMREKQKKAEERKQMEAAGITPPPEDDKKDKKKKDGGAKK